jgi:3-deoxy-D-manno-octulosonic acid kinase
MEERLHSQSLVTLARTDASRAQTLLPQVSDVMARLISHHIHHVDLHPGNVLVDAEDRICLVDFDKTARVTLTKAELAERYHRRWQRAVVKHALPSWLGNDLRIPI